MKQSNILALLALLLAPRVFLQLSLFQHVVLYSTSWQISLNQSLGS